VLSIIASHSSGLDRHILDAEFCSPGQEFYPVSNGLLDLDHSFHLLRRSFRRLTFGEGLAGKNVFGELPDTKLSRRRAKIFALCVCSHRSLTTRSYRLGVISCFKSSWLRSDLAACFVPIFIFFLSSDDDKLSIERHPMFQIELASI
jgi:hypothetical protein